MRPGPLWCQQERASGSVADAEDHAMGKCKTQQLPKDKRLPYRGRRYEVRQLTVLACGQGGPWTWREWWIYDHNLGRDIGAAYRERHVADHEAARLNRAYASSHNARRRARRTDGGTAGGDRGRGLTG